VENDGEAQSVYKQSSVQLAYQLGEPCLVVGLGAAIFMTG